VFVSFFYLFLVVHISYNFFSVSCLGDRFMEWNAKVESKDSVFHLGFLVMFLIVWTGWFYFCFGHVQWCWQRFYVFVSVMIFHLLYSYCGREHIYNLRYSRTPYAVTPQAALLPIQSGARIYVMIRVD